MNGSMPYNAPMRWRNVLFLPVILLPLGCNGGSNAYVAPRVPLQTLLSSVPEELRYDPPSIAAEENGWVVLAKGYAETPRLRQDAVTLFEESGSHIKHSEESSRRAAFEKVFEEYAPYLDATEKHIAITRRAAIVTEPGDNSVDTMTGLRVQLSLFIRRAAFRLAVGDVEKAVGDYKTSVKLVGQFSSSGAPINYIVIASSLWSRVDREIRWAACHPNMTEAGLRELYASLPSDEVIVEDFKRSIRVELRKFIDEEVQRLSGPGGNSLTHRDAKESYRDFDSGWDQADEVAAQVLDGHERPFDRKATVDSAVQLYRETLKNVDRKWVDQVSIRNSIVSLIRDWPMSRLAGETGESEEAEAELKIARPKLLASENPYGKFALWYFVPFSHHSEVAPFRTRADINGTKALIAIRVSKIRNGRFPNDFKDLEAASGLGSIPLDPFTDGPFGYDALSAKLWSKGPQRPGSEMTRSESQLSKRQEYSWSFADLKEPAMSQKPSVGLVQADRKVSVPKSAPVRTMVAPESSSP